jgi:nickel-dependent lactate racemase
VREVINRAMSLVTTQTYCLAMVVKSKSELYGLYAGDCSTAWSEAADLSRQVHINYTGRSYHTVLGTCSQMYDELWTGGKVMYKLEQVVADGGRLIIYAPHITEISRTWGKYIEEIGYHVRDYFLQEPERFKGIPRGVLAHSTHVRGVGRMEDGVEKPRIEVVLASGISPEVCERINLGYLDPQTIDPDEYRDRDDQGVLLVENAGEILHLVKPKAAQE